MATFYNRATLSFNGESVTSNVTVGQLLGSLAVTKTALVGEYGANDAVTFIVRIENTSNSPLANLTLTDNLGEYNYNGEALTPLYYTDGSLAYFVNGDAAALPAVESTAPLVLTGIDLDAGGSALIIYQARVNEFAPLEAGAAIVNEATVFGDYVSAVKAAATITAAADERISITKTLDPTVVRGGGEITYTFTIENYGASPLDASDNAVIEDVFDPALRNISVTFNTAAWTEGVNYTYDEQTGEFASVGGEVTVPGATFVRENDGSYTTVPGVSTLEISGTI